MGPEDKIQKVAVEAAGLDCSRTMEDENFKMKEQILRLLEEKNRRLKLQIAEMRGNVAEKQGELNLIKERVRRKQQNLQSRRQYHTELAKALEAEKGKNEKLFKTYEDMIQESQKTWDSYLEIYNRFPLALKKSELENNLKLRKFENMSLAQSQKNLEQKIEQIKQIKEVIQEAREREKAALSASLNRDRARARELDRIKKEKIELIARLRERKAEKERVQRLGEMKSTVSNSLPIPMIAPSLIPGQLSLQNYHSASQPAGSTSELPRAQMLKPSSQNDVVLSFNRREIHSRIIEERCFVVIPPSAPTMNYNTAPQYNTSGDVEMADASASVIIQETNTVGNEHDGEIRLVDRGYGGSDSSPSLPNDKFSQQNSTPEFSPFETPIQNSQHGQQALPAAREVFCHGTSTPVSSPIQNSQRHGQVAPFIQPSDPSDLPHSAEVCNSSSTVASLKLSPPSHKRLKPSNSSHPVLTTSLSQTSSVCSSSFTSVSQNSVFAACSALTLPTMSTGTDYSNRHPAPTVLSQGSTHFVESCTQKSSTMSRSSIVSSNQRSCASPAPPINPQVVAPPTHLHSGFALPSPRRKSDVRFTAAKPDSIITVQQSLAETFHSRAPTARNSSPVQLTARHSASPAPVVKQSIGKDNSNISSQTVRSTPTTSPLMHVRTEPIVQAPTHNSVPPSVPVVPVFMSTSSQTSQREIPNISQPPTEPTQVRTEGEMSRYFIQQADIADPVSSGDIVSAQENHGDDQSNRTVNKQNFQQPGYADSDFGEESNCPFYPDEDEEPTSPRTIFKSPEGLDFVEGEKDFGATDFGFASRFQNPFGGSSNANDNSSGQTKESAFSFMAAPVKTIFNLF